MLVQLCYESISRKYLSSYFSLNNRIILKLRFPQVQKYSLNFSSWQLGCRIGNRPIKFVFPETAKSRSNCRTISIWQTSGYSGHFLQEQQVCAYRFDCNKDSFDCDIQLLSTHR